MNTECFEKQTDYGPKPYVSNVSKMATAYLTRECASLAERFYVIGNR